MLSAKDGWLEAERAAHMSVDKNASLDTARLVAYDLLFADVSVEDVEDDGCFVYKCRAKQTMDELALRMASGIIERDFDVRIQFVGAPERGWALFRAEPLESPREDFVQRLKDARDAMPKT